MNTPIERSKVEGDLHRVLGRDPGVAARWLASFQSNAGDGIRLRAEVNSFLRTQLGAVENTMEARLCLSEESEYRHWLSQLGRYVVPALSTNQLPVPYSVMASWFGSK